jgi:hypothetical protein
MPFIAFLYKVESINYLGADLHQGEIFLINCYIYLKKIKKKEIPKKEKEKKYKTIFLVNNILQILNH